MPPSANPLCVQCAKLSRDEAIALHGSEGTGVQCWKVKTCDNRRHYHRNAPMFNQVRKQRRRQQKGTMPAVSSLGASSTLQLQGDFHPGEAVVAAPRRSRSERTETVTVPTFDAATPHAYLYWYRRAKDAPVHAIAAELWIGDHRRARACFHVTGGGAMQIKETLLHVLQEFSTLAGSKVRHFRDEVELMPDRCPLRPCPLHPEP